MFRKGDKEDQPGDVSHAKAQLSEDDGDRMIVLCAQNGDLQAFEQLYERYNTRIVRFLCRMVGDDGAACELAQDTFLKAWGALPRLHAPERFAGWLYRIATNCALNYLHHRKQQMTFSWNSCGSETEQISVEGPEESIVQHDLLQQALLHVSATYRSCLILSVIERLPQRRIAEILGMKESCVSQYVSRGKKELRHMYYLLQEGDARRGYQQ